jgi:hypothetical protein
MSDPNVIVYDASGRQIGHLRGHSPQWAREQYWDAELLPPDAIISGGGKHPFTARGRCLSGFYRTMDEAARAVREAYADQRWEVFP